MSEDEPLVSVGLPVRNGERTIEETVASVLAQTYQNIELVILDNASTDATEEICRELARRDARIRYRRHPENIGMFNNDVEVVRAARGPYYRLIGDDDLMLPSCIGACMDAALADPRIVLVTTEIEYVTEDGDVNSEVYTGSGLGSDDPADRASEMLRLLNESYRQLDPLYGLMRRAIIDIPRNNMLREDQILAMRLALAGPWAHVPQVHFRRNWSLRPNTAVARSLGVPEWRARFVNALQIREMFRFVAEADLTPEQRARVRAAIYRMYVRRHQLRAARGGRKLVGLARGQ